MPSPVVYTRPILRPAEDVHLDKRSTDTIPKAVELRPGSSTHKDGLTTRTLVLFACGISIVFVVCYFFHYQRTQSKLAERKRLRKAKLSRLLRQGPGGKEYSRADVTDGNASDDSELDQRSTVSTSLSAADASSIMLPGERDLDAIKKALKASSQPVEDDMEDEPSMSRTRPLHTVLEIDDAGVKTPSANCSAVGLERRSHGSGAWSITPRAEPAASQCHATPVWDEEVEPPAQKSKREAASNGAQPASDAAPALPLYIELRDGGYSATKMPRDGLRNAAEVSSRAMDEAMSKYPPKLPRMSKIFDYRKQLSATIFDESDNKIAASAWAKFPAVQVGSVRIDLPPAAEFEEADPFDNRQPNHSNLEL